jgi:hypothetical protein
MTIDKKRMEFHMPYVSYTSMKIVHDQKIEEALEHSRFSAGQETQKRGLLQTFGAFLARFTNFSARKPKATLPGCDGELEGREASPLAQLRRPLQTGRR